MGENFFFSDYMSDKELISKIYNEFLLLNNKIQKMKANSSIFKKGSESK